MIVYDPSGTETVVLILTITATVVPGDSNTVELLIEAVGPFVTMGEIETTKETLPEKPRLLTDKTAAAYPPTMITLGLGVRRERVKSVTVTDNAVECFIEPTLAVTVTAYVPTGADDEAETVRVDVPDPPAGRIGLAGMKDTVGPLATIGDIEAENVRVPLRRFTLDAVIVDEPDDATVKEKDEGVAETTKSPGVKMLTVEVTVLVEPLITEIVSE
jgi:hypothetical protein